MTNNKHLTPSDRFMIEQSLNHKCSFRHIARELSKDPTTIAKEVKAHIQFKKTGATGRIFNDCANRISCHISYLCSNSDCRNKLCKFCSCSSCSSLCNDYHQEICASLTKPPYVCNGCEKRKNCSLEKRLYSAYYSQKEYETVRSESRRGLQISEADALRLDTIISPLLIQGQSLHAICHNHMDEIMFEERTLYNYIDAGIFTARNIDLPRRVRFSRRKPIKPIFKVDRTCRESRTYIDFISFLEVHPDTAVVEMDSVEGKKGGKVLLTIHFTVPQFMLSFIRDANTSQSVIDIFERLYMELFPDVFCALFPLLLGDNGSEFSNPKAIEYDYQGNHRTNVFYCDPSAPYQKGAAENNHEMIRRIIPKGTSLDELDQEDIRLMMNHINSYGRKKLGGKCPYEVFRTLYGEDILRKLGAELIPPDKVTLRPSLLKK